MGTIPNESGLRQIFQEDKAISDLLKRAHSDYVLNFIALLHPDASPTPPSEALIQAFYSLVPTFSQIDELKKPLWINGHYSQNPGSYIPIVQFFFRIPLKFTLKDGTVIDKVPLLNLAANANYTGKKLADLVKTFFDWGVPGNDQDLEGKTPLHILSQRGETEAFDALLTRLIGNDYFKLYKQDVKGNTIVHACLNSPHAHRAALLQTLLNIFSFYPEKASVLNQHDQAGLPPLYYAFSNFDFPSIFALCNEPNITFDFSVPRPDGTTEPFANKAAADLIENCENAFSQGDFSIFGSTPAAIQENLQKVLSLIARLKAAADTDRKNDLLTLEQAVQAHIARLAASMLPMEDSTPDHTSSDDMQTALLPQSRTATFSGPALRIAPTGGRAEIGHAEAGPPAMGTPPKRLRFGSPTAEGL